MESALIVPAIVAIITAIFASGIWQLIAQRKQTAAGVEKTRKETEKLEEENKKLKADTAQILQDSSLEMVMEYKKQLEEIKKEHREQMETVKSEHKKQLEAVINEVRLLKNRTSKLEEELKEAYIEINRLNNLNKDLNRRLAGLEKN
jgi:cell shape-determining protein MreC